MVNNNFHVSFSSSSKMVPPHHQNHFSPTSIKTRRKFCFLLRNSNYSLFPHIGRLTLVGLFLSYLLAISTQTLALEDAKNLELHPLIVLAESQNPIQLDNDNNNSKDIVEKREGRQYDYENSSNEQQRSARSTLQQKSPQDLVSGKKIYRYLILCYFIL